MAGLKDVREIGIQIVGPVLKNRPRALRESQVGDLVHAYLLGAYAGVAREYTTLIGKQELKIDFRFGDQPHGHNPCVLELAVRHTEGGSLAASQNQTELKKLSRFPKGTANGGRYLLLLDLANDKISQDTLTPSYDAYYLGPGKYEKSSISIVYVHRDLNYRFIWSPYRADSV